MPRKKKKKKPSKLAEMREDINPGIPQEIKAIFYLVISFLLLLAFINAGGSLVNAAFELLRRVFGMATYMFPAIWLLLAFMLFQPNKYEVKTHNRLGLWAFVFALTGLLHIWLPSSEAAALAAEGLGGGEVGNVIAGFFLAFMNVTASAIVLFALLVISIVIAANARVADIWLKVKSMFGRRGEEEPEIEVNEMGNAHRLPIKGTLGGKSSEAPSRGDEAALTIKEDEDWVPPDINMLEQTTDKPDTGNVKDRAAKIQETLASFGINVTMGKVNVGPTVTQYTLTPESGVKLNKITGLEHNLALELAAEALRVEAPIPGKSAVGIEIPNARTAMVRMQDTLTAPEVVAEKSPLAFVLGKDVAGKSTAVDLSKMPHLLIAGATGSGKSVMINVLITSLLYRNSPSNLKMILVDPKKVELSLYNDIPHLLSQVIVEPEKCISALKWAVAEMERRYELLRTLGKRNIGEYNSMKKSELNKANKAVGGEDSNGPVELDESMPYIVIIIDELADLMMVAAKDVETLIVRLAQMARAVGIHLVLATQRPSVDVITGLIKANVPARLAFTTASQVDSRTILDQSGAEKLLGKGDMLFSSPEFIKPKRIQGVFLDETEVRKVTDYLRGARKPQYNEEIVSQPVKIDGGRGVGGGDGEKDPMFDDAVTEVIRNGKASASFLQRRLRVGYARAANLLDQMEERGVIGPADGARPRDVLISSASELGGAEAAYDE